MRDDLKPYLQKTAEETVQSGLPMMRAMFIEFPDDKNCYDLDDQYMFGSKYLVAPVTEYGAKQRSVYLPKGEWKDINGSHINSSGQFITADAPFDVIPVFERKY